MILCEAFRIACEHHRYLMRSSISRKIMKADDYVYAHPTADGCYRDRGDPLWCRKLVEEKLMYSTHASGYKYFHWTELAVEFSKMMAI